MIIEIRYFNRNSSGYMRVNLKELFYPDDTKIKELEKLYGKIREPLSDRQRVKGFMSLLYRSRDDYEQNEKSNKDCSDWLMNEKSILESALKTASSNLEAQRKGTKLFKEYKAEVSYLEKKIKLFDYAISVLNVGK